jgi:universal stress protein A
MTAVLEKTSDVTTSIHGLNPLAVKNILVPVDFSRTSLEALRYAIPLARRFRAKISLLHVMVDMPYPRELGYTAKSENEKLESIEKRLDRLGHLTMSKSMFKRRFVRVGDAADAITLLAREEKCDLIVLTTHGWTGFKHFTMGSTAEKVVRLAPCPVLAVRKPEHEPTESVRQDLVDMICLSSDIS